MLFMFVILLFPPINMFFYLLLRINKVTKLKQSLKMINICILSVLNPSLLLAFLE